MAYFPTTQIKQWTATKQVNQDDIMIDVNGKLWASLSNRTTGSTFDITEQANWKMIGLDDGISKISSTTVSALTLNTVVLYTVPTGRNLSVTNIVIKVKTIAGVVSVAPSISIGTNATTYDNILATLQLAGATIIGKQWTQPILGLSSIANASDIITAQIDVAQVGATVLDYTIELYGNLI